MPALSKNRSRRDIPGLPNDPWYVNLNKDQNKRRLALSIFIIWLFHLSGLLGILLGYGEWFIPKTPVNLLLSGILFVWVFPIRKGAPLLLFLSFAMAGMVVEWIGVHSGLLFGSYAYGANLGPKWFGVPLLIGLNWALLGMGAGAISSKWVKGRLAGIVLGALLMTLLDMAIEPLAPRYDFWEFEGGHAPLSNYLSWFGIAVLFQWCYQRWKPEDGYFISAHLLMAQFVFFSVLTLYTYLY